MESQQLQDHDHSDTNLLLAIILLFLNWADKALTISDSTVNLFQFLVALVLLLVNLDKLYDVGLKWYLKIKQFFKL